MKTEPTSKQPDAAVPCTGVVGDGAESEACEYCEGLGSIAYNPNLNPTAFPATTTAKCRHCGGTGRAQDDASRAPAESRSATGDADAQIGGKP